MLNVHTRMYAHKSQINANHDIFNIGHERTNAKLILGVFKNTRFYKSCLEHNLF